MSEIQKNFDLLYNINYMFNDYYGLSYMTPESYNGVCNSLSFLREKKEINGHEYRLLKKILGHNYKNYIKIRYLESVEPRKVAQRFIGRKKIRRFIFKRDKYKCLKCGSKEKLSIDHIVPVNKQGENKLSNLQTLCKSCNCSKSDNFKDYRNGN